MAQQNTFVFGDTEVKKTGRAASKPMPGGKIMTLVEITPASEYDGNWKKFVNPSTLFIIDGVPDHPPKNPT